MKISVFSPALLVVALLAQFECRGVVIISNRTAYSIKAQVQGYQKSIIKMPMKKEVRFDKKTIAPDAEEVSMPKGLDRGYKVYTNGVHIEGGLSRSWRDTMDDMKVDVVQFLDPSGRVKFEAIAYPFEQPQQQEQKAGE